MKCYNPILSPVIPEVDFTESEQGDRVKREDAKLMYAALVAAHDALDQSRKKTGFYDAAAMSKIINAINNVDGVGRKI